MWGTEWKYHGSKSIHRYQNQILNRNGSENTTKEGDKLAQGLAKLTTDKPRVIVVQVGQVQRYQEYWKQQIRDGHVNNEIILRLFKFGVLETILTTREFAASETMMIRHR